MHLEDVRPQLNDIVHGGPYPQVAVAVDINAVGSFVDEGDRLRVAARVDYPVVFQRRTGGVYLKVGVWIHLSVAGYGVVPHATVPSGWSVAEEVVAVAFLLAFAARLYRRALKAHAVCMAMQHMCTGVGVGGWFAQRHHYAAVLEEEGCIVQLCRIAHLGIPLAGVLGKKDLRAHTECIALWLRRRLVSGPKPYGKKQPDEENPPCRMSCQMSHSLL